MKKKTLNSVNEIKRELECMKWWNKLKESWNVWSGEPLYKNRNDAKRTGRIKIANDAKWAGGRTIQYQRYLYGGILIF